MDGPSRQPDEKLGLGARGAVSDMDRIREAENELLRQCSLDSSTKKRLFNVLEKFRSRADSPGDMLTMFGDKCFKSEPTSDMRFKASNEFCKLAFGDIDRLFRKGPESTFHKMVVNLALYEGLKQPTEFKFSFGDYRVGRRLGSGATAMVFFGQRVSDNRRVAIKVFKPVHSTLKLAYKEYMKLTEMQHPNVLNVLDFFEGATWLMPPMKPGDRGRKIFTSVMIMEYCAKGELMQQLKSDGKFSPALARWAFNGILDGIIYTHSKDLAHCDLKLANVFVTGDDEDRNSKVVVGDFGFVTDMKPGDKQSKNYGTPQYYAPEMHLNMGWTRNVDMFSMGIMLFVMLFGYFPFERATAEDPWYSRVIRDRWDKFWRSHARQHKVSDDAMKLIQGMLSYQPSDRLSIEKIQSHPWTRSTTLTNQEAYLELQHRKDKTDARQLAESEQSRKRRAIADWNEKLDHPAPFYNTNIPVGEKNWFYSRDSPRVICLNLSDIIKRELKGETDCNIEYKKWGEYLISRGLDPHDPTKTKTGELVADRTKLGSVPSEEMMEKPSGLKPSAVKMATDSTKKAALATAPAPPTEPAPSLAPAPAPPPVTEVADTELAAAERLLAVLQAGLLEGEGLPDEELARMREEIAKAAAEVKQLRGDVTETEEKKEEGPATVVSLATSVVLKPYVGAADIPETDLATCEGRIIHNQFELNFAVEVTKSLTQKVKQKVKGDKKKKEKEREEQMTQTIRLNGLVQVFACPAQPKYSIVTFVPTSSGAVVKCADGALVNEDDKVNTTELFNEVFSQILKQGGNALMIDTRDTRRELEELAAKKVPDLFSDDIAELLAGDD